MRTFVVVLLFCGVAVLHGVDPGNDYFSRFRLVHEARQGDWYLRSRIVEERDEDPYLVLTASRYSGDTGRALHLSSWYAHERSTFYFRVLLDGLEIHEDYAGIGPLPGGEGALISTWPVTAARPVRITTYSLLYVGKATARIGSYSPSDPNTRIVRSLLGFSRHRFMANSEDVLTFSAGDDMREVFDYLKIPTDDIVEHVRY